MAFKYDPGSGPYKPGRGDILINKSKVCHGDLSPEHQDELQKYVSQTLPKTRHI